MSTPYTPRPAPEPEAGAAPQPAKPADAQPDKRADAHAGPDTAKPTDAQPDKRADAQAGPDTAKPTDAVPPPADPAPTQTRVPPRPAAPAQGPAPASGPPPGAGQHVAPRPWPGIQPMPGWRPPQPRQPSAFARRWPGPAGGPAERLVLGGAAATGLVAAASVPLSRPGLGWLLAGLVGATVIVAAARQSAAPIGPVRYAWGAATVALLAAGTIRAAGWLFVLCVLTAFVTGSLAAAGGRSVAGLAASVVAWPAAVVRSLPWAARGLAVQRRARGGTAIRTVLAAIVTALLLLIFGSLLASADEAFAKVLDTVTPDLEPTTLPRWIFLFVVGTLGLLGAAYLVSAPPDLTGLEQPATRRVRRLEWMLPVAALDVLFATFVAVQFTVLFGGVQHVLGLNGPSFAEYARKGFWQLLVVTLLTLAVLGMAARWAPRETASDRLVIRLLLGLLALCSLVIVASALYRMHVYEEAYGFTRLRVLVSACELWLGAVFVMVLVAGVRLRAAWLPRVVVAAAVAALLGLVALNPDRFIAERNIDRYADIGRIDVNYLSRLSADAVPAFNRLPPDRRTCALYLLAGDLKREPDGWNSWNLGRSRARAILADFPIGDSTACWRAD